MIDNIDRDFLIPSDEIQKIKPLLQSVIKRRLMTDNIVRRALYEVQKTETQDEHSIRWLRILDGDIDCNFKSHCTVTYKDKKSDMSGEEFASLDVNNFEDALHLFELLRFRKTSYQENMRSKFVCEFDGIQYLVRFDIWPKIEDVVFVAVRAKSAAEKDDIDGFVEYLKLPTFNIEKSNKVDVDKIYKDRYSISATYTKSITFEYGLEE